MLKVVHSYWVQLIEFGDRWTTMNLLCIVTMRLTILYYIFKKQMSYAETIILFSTFGTFLYC